MRQSYHNTKRYFTIADEDYQVAMYSYNRSDESDQYIVPVLTIPEGDRNTDS